MSSKDIDISDLPPPEDNGRQPAEDLPPPDGDLPPPDDGGYKAAPWYDKALKYNWRTKEKLKPTDPDKTPQEDEGVGQALGYPGGVATTAVIQGAKALAGKGKMSELVDALKGKAKSAPQQLEESGWPKAASWAAGLPLQAVTDPMADTMGMRTGVQDATGAVGNAVEKGLFKHAFADVDRQFGGKKQYANRLGETPFTDQALKDRIFTPGMSVQEQEQALVDQLYKKNGDGMNDVWDRNQNLRTAPGNAALSPDFKEWMQEQGKYQNRHDDLQALVNYMQKDQNSFLHNANPEEMTQMAKDASQVAQGTAGLPGDIYGRFGKSTVLKEGMAKYADELRSLRNRMVAEANPDDAQALGEMGKAYSVYKTAEKPMRQLAKKWQSKMPITAADGILTAMGKLPLVAAKKGVQYAHSPTGAVRLGTAAHQMGESPIWDQMAQQALQGRDEDK